MLQLILDIILYVFIGVFTLALIYYIPRMKGWFASFKKQKTLYNEKKNKIAIIVPARNESKVIGDLFDSIKRQTYDKENFDVHIIVKEPTDETIEKSKCVDGVIHIATNQKCKGDALDFCFKEILEQYPDKYDSYVIVDADCIIDDKFLEEMNNAMASGADIIQAKKLVKNYILKNKKANSMASMCNGLIWTLIDDMGNRYKSDKKITGMTIGTGIMFSNAIVKEFGGWPYRQTLTEDIELMNDCAIKNYSTFYYSYAKMYLEESTSLSMTNKRRTRWLTGLLDSKVIYKKQLNSSAKTKLQKRNKYFVTAVTPVIIMIGSCLVFSIIQILFAIALSFITTPLALKSLNFAILGILMIYLCFFIMTIVCLIVERKNMPISIWKKLAILFVHPIYYMGYINICLKWFLGIGSNRGWEVIERIDFNLATEQPVCKN